MNATHGDCQLLRELEADENFRKIQAMCPECCVNCRELFVITIDERFDAIGTSGKSATYGQIEHYPGCRLSDAEIGTHDTHCDKLVRFRIEKLADDLETFSRDMIKRIKDLQDAITNFLREVA